MYMLPTPVNENLANPLDLTDMPDATACSFYVDVQPRQRAVSISSVDSEPIVQECKQSVSKNTIDNESCDSEEDQHCLQRSGSTIADMPDLEPCSMMESLAPVAEVHTSEAHVAQVLFAKNRSGVVTAESAESNLVFDCGTNVYLNDGTAVGVIQTLFGPVERPLYLVRGQAEHIDALASAQRLCADVRLHTDVRQQVLMTNIDSYVSDAHATDASYVNDEELPEYIRPDFSDDEKEMQWKRNHKQHRFMCDQSTSSNDEVVCNDVDWHTINWDSAT